jgi:CRISPR/Cas system CSM-associated protein Csm3 (group 7 of RAMP superfamily)
MGIVEKYEGWMLAKSFISHIGNEKTGSSPILRTIYIYVDGLGETPIPYINGNSIRGKLRRMLMLDFLKRIEINPEDISTKLYHILFTGGVLESTEETYGVIDLNLRKQIRENLIPVSLIGCAVGNQMIQGKLKVGHAFPVCEEYKKYLPDFLKKDERADIPVRVFTDESFQTRRDELKAEREDEEQAIQMKVDYECFIPGTKFYHWFVLENPTELEKSCFGRMIELFKESPFIGGKSSVGLGEVIFEYIPEPPKQDLYLQYLDENKEKIKTFITDLEEKI